MNVLHVINIYFSLSYFGDQFLHFSRKGYNEHIICSPSEFLPSFAERQNVQYKEVPINRKVSIADDLKAICVVCRYIKKNKIDVVVGHTPKGALVGMIAAWLAGASKRLYFRHGLAYETSGGIKRWVLIACERVTAWCATKVICVSPSVLDLSIKDKLGSRRKQIVLGRGTCGGIDTQKRFNPANVDREAVDLLRASLGINKKDYVIGFTGRLVRDKGIVELVRAFEKIDQNNAGLKLLLVGMFEERDAVPEDVKNDILSNNSIIYTGFVNGGMENYYSMMDLYVLPSYREGFPTGVLEAQSMALPVLTTRATGCVDSIINEKTGLFISHDVDDIAKKIELQRTNKVINGEEGRKWVVENFDNQYIWAEIENLYRD